MLFTADIADHRVGDVLMEATDISLRQVRCVLGKHSRVEIREGVATTRISAQKTVVRM